MKTIRAIIWKEGHAFLRDRLRLVALVFFALVFGIFFAMRYGQLFLVPTALLLMLASAYLWSQAAFQKEVSDKTLTHLLASPMTPRALLLGKSLTVFLFSYVLELIGVTVCTVFSWFRLGDLPSLASVYTALVVVPIWGFALIELFGVIFSLVRSAVGVWLLTTPFYVAVLLSTLSPEASPVIGIVLSSLWLPPVAGLGIAASLYALMGKLGKDWMTRVAS